MNKERTEKKNTNKHQRNTSEHEANTKKLKKRAVEEQSIRFDFDPPSFDFTPPSFSFELPNFDFELSIKDFTPLDNFEDLHLLDNNDFIESLSELDLSGLFQGFDFERTITETKRKQR